jgi:hypothetical protein
MTGVADVAPVAGFWVEREADDFEATAWTEPAADRDRSDGERLLDQVHGFLTRFVAFPTDAAAVATTAWCVHAHAIDMVDTSARLAFLSPEPGSGKTRALEVIELLVPNPMATVNASAAVLFRSMTLTDDQGRSLRPTVLMDEADTIFGPRASKDHEDLRGFINAGYRRGAHAHRAAIRGNGVVVEVFPAFAAVAIAGLDDLPDTVMTRSIVVRMRRRASTERVEPYRRRLHQAQGELLRDRISAWVDWKSQDLAAYVDDLPAGIEDRAADCWEPLVAIGDAAGPDWSRRIRQAAVDMVGQSQSTGETLGIRLLIDLHQAFDGRDSMTTEDVLSALNGLEDSPWGDMRGKPLDARGLSARLRRYGVTSKSIRQGTNVLRGYAAQDLHDPWSRYLPLSSQKGATSATSATADVATTDGPEEWPDEVDEPAWQPDYLIDPEEDVA